MICLCFFFLILLTKLSIWNIFQFAYKKRSEKYLCFIAKTRSLESSVSFVCCEKLKFPPKVITCSCLQVDEAFFLNFIDRFYLRNMQ